jgi:phosphoribosylaminoimidazolecarboxamide formyltransferase/IMP cyclohydrolase
MRKIKRALISVWDKEGIVEFARELSKLDIEILSTGGTMKTLKESGIPVKSVTSYTGFPEMLEGRLKTLHPKIHGGLLAKRDNFKHLEELKNNNIDLIDMVVVNLYPFKSVIQKEGVRLEEAIENIDIGGPTMLRSAAKNFEDVAVITSPKWYPKIIEELKQNKGALTNETKAQLAIEVFALTSDYDTAIANYLRKNIGIKNLKSQNFPLKEELVLKFDKVQNLRYGENPHQEAGFYEDKDSKSEGLTQIQQLQGKELSFNNIMDLDAAFSIVAEFQEPAAAIIKHTNPCGAASAATLKEAYQGALDCDRLSAFGSIVGFNRAVDVEVAQAILEAGFVECIIAPGFDKEALPLFAKRKNLRLLVCKLPSKEKLANDVDFKKVWGGLLVQSRDVKELGELKTVTKSNPTEEQLTSLIFAFKIVKFVKSNAIVLAKDTKTVGIGAGQMSRVDAVIIANRKAGERASGSCLASDAFFPKPDAIEEAAKAGVVAIIQPGGSKGDEQVIKVADKHNIAMVFTGMRHFRH